MAKRQCRRTLIYVVELEATLDGVQPSLGITVTKDMIIETVVENGRADKAGVVAGSRFYSINGKRVQAGNLIKLYEELTF